MMSGLKVQEIFFPQQEERNEYPYFIQALNTKRRKMELHIHDFKAQTNIGH